MDLLTSIKGIGVTLAAALIVATGGFTYFDNAKQLTRYLGLSPIYQQFGTSVNVKGHINQNGDSNLRSQLYVAAFSSLRCNAECKACFDRLRSNGKPGKVAVVAVANKLIRQAFDCGHARKTVCRWVQVRETVNTHLRRERHAATLDLQHQNIYL